MLGGSEALLGGARAELRVVRAGSMAEAMLDGKGGDCKRGGGRAGWRGDMLRALCWRRGGPSAERRRGRLILLACVAMFAWVAMLVTACT